MICLVHECTRTCNSWVVLPTYQLDMINWSRAKLVQVISATVTVHTTSIMKLNIWIKKWSWYNCSRHWICHCLGHLGTQYTVVHIRDLLFPLHLQCSLNMFSRPIGISFWTSPWAGADAERNARAKQQLAAEAGSLPWRKDGFNFDWLSGVDTNNTVFRTWMDMALAWWNRNGNMLFFRVAAEQRQETCLTQAGLEIWQGHDQMKRFFSLAIRLCTVCFGCFYQILKGQFIFLHLPSTGWAINIRYGATWRKL